MAEHHDISVINEKVKKESDFLDGLFFEMEKVIVGQRYLLERLLICLLANGHILIEGVPGLAKTTAVKTLASALQAKFQRLQFTPDMLPADLTGTMIYDPKTSSFYVKKGPVFANIILADEINRAPAKVQSALLEAMQERQVTIGQETLKLDDPFLVMATQNPIEQEGTYPLPEAQVDRFMLKVQITYPKKEEEYRILKRMSFTDKQFDIQKIIQPQDIVRAREVVDEIYMDEKIEHYIVDLISATRDPKNYGMDDLAQMIRYGASPRATIYLALAAKAYAFVQRRGYVTPQDVKTIGMDVLRHRVIVSYEAEAQEQSAQDVIQRIFEQVEVP